MLQFPIEFRVKEQKVESLDLEAEPKYSCRETSTGERRKGGKSGI